MPAIFYTRNSDGSFTAVDSTSIQLARPIVARYPTDGAISTSDQMAELSKTSAGAYTLGAPTTDQNGAVVILCGNTAFAHVVTATGLIADGVTGGYKTTMTFAAFKGATITLRALDGYWIVTGKNAVNIT